MRVVVRQEEQTEFDLCDTATFKAMLQDNPDMILLITKEDCPVCPSLQDAADKVAKPYQAWVRRIE
jgi:hypothetical protein